MCSVSFTTCGFVWDKYMPNQVKQGRFFEPNQAASAVAVGVSWHFIENGDNSKSRSSTV